MSLTSSAHVLVATLAVLANLASVSAAPLASGEDYDQQQQNAYSPFSQRAVVQQFYKRDSSSSNTFKIWVPIILIVIVLLAMGAFTWMRKSGGMSESLSSFSRAAAMGAGAMAPTTELTADQLTGGSSTVAINGDANGGSNRPRRTRRPRRTPSQISTTSLPAYMKEPGEQELVIFRGPPDMEDATVAVDMPPVAEDGEASVHDGRYTPMPDSPNDAPLLSNDDDESGELAAANLRPPGEGMAVRRSTDTGSGESSSLVRVESNVPEDAPDPRGQAPAYFEVVDLSQDDIPAPTSTATASTPTSTTSAPNRRSTFRLGNLFGTLSGNSSTRNTVAPPPAPPPGLPVTSTGDTTVTSSSSSHARGDSGGALSLTSTISRPSMTLRSSTHRPSQSTSSLFSLVNPLTRKKSTATLNSNHLTSPSTISLHSISAPLTHTVVRTEFTYPKSGPTPEQLKLISSRESFARFGVPYGPDAIAFAASTADLGPPPEFEYLENGGESSSSAAVRPGSRLRAESRAAANTPEPVAEAEEGVSHQGDEDSLEGSGESSMSSGLGVVEAPEIRIQGNTPAASPTLSYVVPAVVSENASSTKPELNSEPEPPANVLESTTETKESVNVPTPLEAAVEDTTFTSSSTIENKNTTTSTLATSSQPTSTPDPTPTSPSTKSLDPTPTSSKPLAHVHAQASASPSSFRSPDSHSGSRTPTDTIGSTGPGPRSESRASSFRSVQTFATAAESINSNTNEFGVLGAGVDGGIGTRGSDTPTMSESEYFSESEQSEQEGSRPVTPTRRNRNTIIAGGAGAGYGHFAEGTDVTVRAAAVA